MTNAAKLDHATKVSNYATALASAIEKRKALELSKNASNESIQKALKSLASDCAHADVARLMLSAHADADFINSFERVNNAFNVKSAKKVFNVARYLLKVASLDHYTKAILLSMKRFNSASVLFTQKDAQAALKKSAENANAALLVRYNRIDVDASTASTQASSSLNALQVLNMIVEKRVDATSVFELNEKNALVKSLIKQEFFA